jgi:hypothetical protein
MHRAMMTFAAFGPSCDRLPLGARMVDDRLDP